MTIIKARYIDGYRIEAVFSNGIKKMIDFASVIQRAKGIVKKLEDVEFFKKFTLDPFTIDWNNEIGFDPQDLYEKVALTHKTFTRKERLSATIAASWQVIGRSLQSRNKTNT